MMTLRWQTRSHRRCVMSITFLHADTILASTFLADDSLCSWNVEKGTFLHNICVQEVQRVIASPHHPFVIAVTSQDATVCDVEVGRHLALPKYARAATFMPDGSAFVTGGHDNRLSTWSLQPLLAIQAREANRQITLLPGQGPAFVGITSEGPQVGITPHLLFLYPILMFLPQSSLLTPCQSRPMDGLQSQYILWTKPWFCGTLPQVNRC